MKRIKRIALVVVFALMMLQCLSLSAYAKALSAPKKVKAEQTDEKEVTVSWRKVNGAKGYKLQYRKKGGRWISKTIKRTTKKVGKLNPGKTYQFRVRAYKKVDGKKVYGKYSSIKKVKIESGIVSNAVIHKGYTIGTGNTTVYSNSGLSGKIGTIFDTDELVIHSATNTYAYVTYPISRGTKTGYIPRSVVLTQTKGKIYSAKAKITTYKRPGGNSYGYISKNDSVIVLGNKGNYTQVKYPVSGGYKLGFIKTSDCNYYIKGSEQTNTTSIDNQSIKLNGKYKAYNGVNYTEQTSDYRRIAALKKAQKMATVKWCCPADFVTWSSKSGGYNSVTAEDGTRSTKFIKGKIYAGIPYSMINHSYDESSWISLVNKGFSTSTMEGRFNRYPKKGTAKGCDCSYLVYLCLKAGGANITYQRTSDMLNSKYYKKIKKTNLKPGDILLMNGHVMLFAGMSGKKYAVFEATSEGSKTRYTTYSSSDISEYSAYKYVKW